MSAMTQPLRSTRWIPLLIALVTLVVFSPGLGNGFVDWDDRQNFIENPDYRGLGWGELRWMLTAILMGHWTPLTWMTLGLDYLLWGMNPVGYHLTSILVHALNAAVFYFVALYLLRLAMRGLGEGPGCLGAGVAALFFALHPLRAESVAWVTERRDVVSGLFFLLTILLYLRACEAEGQGSRRWLAVSVGCYALALASKAIVMTLPVLLILLDIYPLRRLGGRWREWIAPEARRLWREKVPYFLLALAGAAMALYANRVAMPYTRFDNTSLSAHLAIASESFWFYFRKTLLPFSLSPLYEVPTRADLLEPRFLLSAIAVGLLSGGFWLLRRRWPAGLAVWAAYGVLLAPVSGLVIHSGPQLVADRYSYLACLGWALLIGAGTGAAVRAGAVSALKPSVVRLTVGLVGVWIVGLTALTVTQIQVWRDTETLWRYAIEVNPECSICHSALGTYLVNSGYTASGLGHLEQAVALRQDRIPHDSLGLALLNTGRLPEAIEQLRLALVRRPDDVGSRNNLAVALIRQGTPEKAMAYLEEVIQLDPKHVWGHTNLGTALTALGRPAEALGPVRRAIELNPESVAPHFELGRAYVALGQPDAAREEYEILRRLDPHLARVLFRLMNTRHSDSAAGRGLSSEQAQLPRSSGGRGHHK